MIEKMSCLCDNTCMNKTIIYKTPEDKEPYTEWLSTLDKKSRAIIVYRVNKLERGILGDIDNVGDEVIELRIHFGPGFRVYISQIALNIYLILCGGSKRKQKDNIKAANSYLKEYKNK